VINDPSALRSKLEQFANTRRPPTPGTLEHHLRDNLPLLKRAVYEQGYSAAALATELFTDPHFGGASVHTLRRAIAKVLSDDRKPSTKTGGSSFTTVRTRPRIERSDSTSDIAAQPPDSRAADASARSTSATAQFTSESTTDAGAQPPDRRAADASARLTSATAQFTNESTSDVGARPPDSRAADTSAPSTSTTSQFTAFDEDVTK
jgi:hypothetical protein